MNTGSSNGRLAFFLRLYEDYIISIVGIHIVMCHVLSPTFTACPHLILARPVHEYWPSLGLEESRQLSITPRMLYMEMLSLHVSTIYYFHSFAFMLGTQCEYTPGPWSETINTVRAEKMRQTTCNPVCAGWSSGASLLHRPTVEYYSILWASLWYKLRWHYNNKDAVEPRLLKA